MSPCGGCALAERTGGQDDNSKTFRGIRSAELICVGSIQWSSLGKPSALKVGKRSCVRENHNPYAAGGPAILRTSPDLTIRASGLRNLGAF
jgi:hypothetical protein